ncbi:MAG: PD-(D/E)XK nuclease family protein [Chloroflexi bacterium]|nr:PD-(D/E)XK nuclease family protein [Chloroflexota bacterium]
MLLDADRKALETFLLDNPELAQLEALLDEFNIFEAIGAVRQEVRHSDFLAFLLNPRERHGLGAAFGQQLLLTAVQTSEHETGITAVDLSLWKLDDLQVLREWQNIDILLLDETHRFAVIIENKVDSGEHSEQLQRYWRIVRQRYPDWQIVGLFLAPDSREPSDDRYIPLDYGRIHDLVMKIADTRASTLDADVQALMRHYAQMLRRHIMPDSDIAQLAQRIYKKHQRALDLIYEHRPDLQSELRDYLITMIEATPGMILDHATKTYVRCCSTAWDAPILRQGEGWTPTGRMLLLEFSNRADRLLLRLYIGPGPHPLREQLYNLALAYPQVFNVSKRGGSVQGSYKTIFGQDYLRARDYEGATLDELTPKVQQKWESFVCSRLGEITTALQSATWLWTDGLSRTTGF